MKPRLPSPSLLRPVLAAVVLVLVTPAGFAQTPTPLLPPPATALAQPALTGPAAAATNPLLPPGPAQKISGDIRDIRGPIHLPPPLLWVWWLAGGLALAALLYAGWRWRQHRARAAALLPYQIALARLEEARALMQPENAREFSILVSEIVRQFIEERFHVRAARRTTEEFLRDLLAPSDALLVNHRALLADFLQHCDLAKFARWILSTSEMTTMLQSAHNFVSETGPEPDPAQATSGPTSSTQNAAVPANP
ncbi:MAG: hypothetical protein ABI222_07710 [Opitutaceae bacterium]